jgi:membrane dipeptidase
MTLARRDFLGGAAAAAFGPALANRTGSRPSVSSTIARAPAWPGYENAMVIDFLGSPGYFNYPENPPLNPAMIENARRSGITAMNVTVSGGDFVGTMRRISPWLEYVSRYAETFRQVRTIDELLDAKKTRRVGIVLGFQDTTPYGPDITLVDVFHQVGVRVVQLTYNNRNLVGDGCLEPGNAGLSQFGQRVVERLNELGEIVDLSHCGKRTTAEGIRASKSPVGITHTGCNEVARHPRSKDDEELKAMADRGGVVGIYMVGFLSPGRVSTAADLIAHVEHALKVCGEDHVGIGSDLSITPIDGSAEYWANHRKFVAGRIAAGIAAPAEDPEILFNVPELNTERRMERIADLLASRRHSDRVIEKVIGGNWLRLCREVWK